MAYTDSEPGTVVLALQGVWIMDPTLGGQESIRSFPYGAAQRDEALGVMGQDTFYAGRMDPVTDYGEHEDYAMGVTVDVPHGPTWLADLDCLRAFSRAKRVLHFRDNRGRAFYGVMEGFKISDTAWGSQVSFTAGRRDYARETVAA